MDQQAIQLGDHILQRLCATASTERILIGLAGVPASGKSTLAQLIVDHVNKTTRREHAGVDHRDIAVLIGLDGWHLSRAQLDAMPDPKLARDRRGAHWTFDGEAYVDFVRALRKPHTDPASAVGESDAVYAPSFDHAVKDPMPRAVAVHPYHRVVLIEGLYGFLGVPPWREAAEMLDERWWLEVSEEEAEQRLVARHVRSGVAKDLEEAIWRSRENDAPNGRFIKKNLLEPTRTIQSVEDPVHASV
ncbi:P-loop containing nucleoside triphosphate hydrolase protein [Fomitopsis serialis]|uniref:P-loop containing nucleoside triphosphate hydrolase protein n=1 Tax=Fomitopsis serialis TaxID=139415 RepID=UPI0020075850|nr:P-loop containing nucleoside triphosphate hydrolase protein [Neoantrodia serialis]KAH9920300.1 P-loop containing nucleoside triphosphate hydrolase protein [Neoantrodia serialis]